MHEPSVTPTPTPQSYVLTDNDVTIGPFSSEEAAHAYRTKYAPLLWNFVVRELDPPEEMTL